MNKKFILEIVEKHRSNPQLEFLDQWIEYRRLINRWRWWVSSKYEGFSIEFAPIWWFFVINDILDHLISIDNNMSIHEIKVKINTLRFYVVGNFDDETVDSFIDLENELYYESLVTN